MCLRHGLGIARLHVADSVDVGFVVQGAIGVATCAVVGVGARGACGWGHARRASNSGTGELVGGAWRGALVAGDEAYHDCREESDGCGDCPMGCFVREGDAPRQLVPGVRESVRSPRARARLLVRRVLSAALCFGGG